MSKKTFIHAENNNKILSSNEVRLYVPPEPEKMKVIIWGKELCNGAEWYDFLKCVEEKTEENNQLKQQLAELKEKDNYHLRYELAGADETITNLKEQLAEKDIRIEELEGQFAYECECNKQLVELQKQLEEKQNTIDETNKNFVQAVHDWKALCAEKDKEISKLQASCQQVKTQLAIQELEKVKVSLKDRISMMENEEHSYLQKVVTWYDICDQINNQIKELKGE